MLRWNIASLHLIIPPHILCLKTSSDIVWDNGGLQVVASHILSCFILSRGMLQTKAHRGFQLSSQFKNHHKSFQIMPDFRMTRWASRSERPVTQPPASHLFRAHLKIALHAFREVGCCQGECWKNCGRSPNSRIFGLMLQCHWAELLIWPNT